MSSTSIVWFRQDLRLDDHAPLRAALDRGGSVIPVFIWSPEEETPWAPGAASRWWLHQSLQSLDDELRKRQSRLVFRVGDSKAVLSSLIEETGASALFWGRRYEPVVIERDRTLKAHFREQLDVVESFNTSLLFEPWEVSNKSSKPYQVYTPFSKACFERGIAERLLPEPKMIPAPATWPTSEALAAFNLEPDLDWAFQMQAYWSPGTTGARKNMRRFLGEALEAYDDDRNRPDRRGTSELSPHLHFGELSPRRIWRELARIEDAEGSSSGLETYQREILWREFGYHLLFHFPSTPEEPLRDSFRKFPWKVQRQHLKAWQRGETGYPIVDAGMRQLWSLGWMHNRVRMIVASFLVKNLLIPWQEGAAWFWDTLVDADLASNTLGWQWTAGCGADAAPYFRIFNPVSQGKRFDPEGNYVRRWVPELQHVPTKHLHAPWEAPEAQLDQAGVRLDRDYPQPLVDLAETRERALDAYEDMKAAAA